MFETLCVKHKARRCRATFWPPSVQTRRCVHVFFVGIVAQAFASATEGKLHVCQLVSLATVSRLQAPPSLLSTTPKARGTYKFTPQTTSPQPPPRNSELYVALPMTFAFPWHS
eukprot:9483632-Pyramimonas_sp.AAC.1